MNDVDNDPLRYFQGYPEELKEKVAFLVSDEENFKKFFLNKYPTGHSINTDKQLYEYVNRIKQEYLKNTPTISRVIYEKQKDLLKNTLGTHTFVSRNHGGKLKSKHEIRIASCLKEAPEPLLNMLVVHELAHFKEKDHNRAFYNLCEHMLPDYHQLEFDLRLFLIFVDQKITIY
ncbi:M48 family metallopeptidase [Bacteriovorax sp. Seq25_V]|uniref:M48 metallopeptidase family protein n=1 Tax=Bacteriovorax sp. Seq25_V TaxID=1201288 RepID=UPI000389FC01|nr:YgjP-like metallopeptidase domain-containing protein [Bacteriovorax sp. Seq25_V]EQC47342.1 PF01863 domain protein [Bacteriovorax sp. Seq25_V]